MTLSIITSKHNETFTFRPLAINDSKKLGEFFLSLSKDTCSKFGPHPLTMEVAKKICSKNPTENIQRFIVCNTTEIAGYFIVDFTCYPDEAARYNNYNITLQPSLDPVFAPCIADKYQNAGIASQAMSLIIALVKHMNLRRIVLMGGTQQPNTLARSFYCKFGFKEYGKFYTEHNQLHNIDMMLELNVPE